MSKKCDANCWKSTIDSISQQFGSITASASQNQDGSDVTKRRKNNQSDCNENLAFKSKEKSLSEEPIGLAGLRKLEERKSRFPALNTTGLSKSAERRSCRLRFKSPSDNSQCLEETSLHQVSIVRNNQMKLRSYMKTPRLSGSKSAAHVSALVSTTSSPRTWNITPPKVDDKKKDEAQGSAKRQTTKKRAWSD